MVEPRNISHSRNDRPTVVDGLGISPYVDALSEFVTESSTPITLAIQGDWGSGKTSLLNMMEGKIKGPLCRVVRFSTWQYSQFDMGDDLVLALIEHLIIEMSPSDTSPRDEVIKKQMKIRSELARLGKAAAQGAFYAGMKSIPLGGVMADILAGAVDGAQNREIGGTDDAFDEVRESYRGKSQIVENLKSDLEDYVAASLREGSSSEGIEPGKAMRFVFMIDDLDRLPPSRAVEIMEALKIFLDIEGCVFVLAIDFDVVRQGVNIKFGDDFDSRKAMSFFDKIIQVPFHMPTAAYDTSKFLCSAIGIEPGPESRVFVDLASASIGNNPRSLKRLANTFRLLKKVNVAAGEGKSTAAWNAQLYATLCLQSSYPLYYRDFSQQIFSICGNSEYPDVRVEEFIQEQRSFFEDRYSSGQEPFSNVSADPKLSDSLRAERLNEYGMSAYDALEFARFLDLFRQVFLTNEETSIDGQALAAALRRAAATSVGMERGADRSAPKITYGISNVLRVLGERGAPVTSLEALRSLAEQMDRVEPSIRFEVGASSSGHRAMFYTVIQGKNRPFAEILLAKQGLTIKFGRIGVHEESQIGGWLSQAERLGMKAWRRENDLQHQLVISGLKRLSHAQQDLLVGWLTEAAQGTKDWHLDS